MIAEILGSIAAAIVFYFMELCNWTAIPNVDSTPLVSPVLKNVELKDPESEKAKTEVVLTAKRISASDLNTVGDASTARSFKKLPPIVKKESRDLSIGGRPCGQCIVVRNQPDACNKCINLDFALPLDKKTIQLKPREESIEAEIPPERSKQAESKSATSKESRSSDGEARRKPRKHKKNKKKKKHKHTKANRSAGRPPD